jgi:hypothetical protein
VAKYRDYSYEQSRLLAVSLKNQIRPGTIEYTIYYLVDHEFEKNLGKVVESIEETFGVCQLRKKCLRSSASKVRQATKIDAGIRHKQNSAVQQTAERFDSLRGRFFYSRRMGTVEPVFANVRHTFEGLAFRRLVSQSVRTI